MAETIGSLVDKLSIVELRRWHTEEAMLNPEAPVDVRHECALRLAVIDEQRADLSAELSALWEAIISGKTPPKVYRQLKMYNDDSLRTASQRVTAAPADHVGSGHEPGQPSPARSEPASSAPLRNVVAFRRRSG
jgi:hypothetical protein